VVLVYGGSFGSRAMIEFYVVLSIPLAAFIHTVFQKKRNWLLKSLTSVILVFLVWLNLFQTTQYRGQVIHIDSMSKKAYWSVFLKNKKPENYQELLIPADAGETLQRSTKN
jgi:presenilin-like A22 family membrane protease